MDLLKALKAKNARVLVLSDANTHFIDVILKVHFLGMCLCVCVCVCRCTCTNRIDEMCCTGTRCT